jgi:hypothetical protein
VTSIRLLGEQVGGALTDYGNLLHDMSTKGFWTSLAGSLTHQLRVTQNQFVAERVTWTEIGLSFGRLAHAPWRLR